MEKVFWVKFHCWNCYNTWLLWFEKGDRVMDDYGDKLISRANGKSNTVHCPLCDATKIAVWGRGTKGFFDKLMERLGFGAEKNETM